MFKTVRKIESYQSQCEDRAEVIPHSAGPVIVLADGAGGTTGGAEAADTVVLWVRAYVSRGADVHDAEGWRELLATIDLQINAFGGQTTAVVAAVSVQGVVGASVGDSAAWMVRADGWQNLTAAQVRKPLLGSGEAKPVAFAMEGFSGTLLVTSDGLVKYAPVPKICAAATGADIEVAARQLVDLVRLRSGALQDDVSVVLCRQL